MKTLVITSAGRLLLMALAFTPLAPVALVALFFGLATWWRRCSFSVAAAWANEGAAARTAGKPWRGAAAESRAVGMAAWVFVLMPPFSFFARNLSFRVRPFFTEGVAEK